MNHWKVFAWLPVMLAAELAAPAARAMAAASPAHVASAAVRSSSARLQSASFGGADVRYHPATGAARFVRIPGGAPQPRALAATPRARAEAFVDEFAGLFGLRDARELRHRSTTSDAGGATHLAYDQTWRGLEVFGARLLVHLDDASRVTAANGVTIPEIDVDPVPSLSSGAAEAAARRHGGVAGLAAKTQRLLVFHDGILRGAAGEPHLAWEVELSGGPRIRELLYIDAHSGKLLERIAGVHEAIERHVYEPSFTMANLIWSEGDSLPYGDANVDSIIESTLQTYQLYSNLSGGDWLSYDGNDHALHAVNDIGQVLITTCPNAFWNSTTANFCDQVTSDDIVAHEWTHAYTEHTGGLVYAYQSGALNESFSDIFGETVDLLNGDGTDVPDLVRGAGVCSQNATNTVGHELLVTAPAGVAGSYTAGAAEFGPPLNSTGVSGAIVLADDADTSEDGRVDDGCQPFVNAAAVAGKIALVHRGGCLFVDKALNAQAAGAAGMVVVNNQGNGILTMAGDDETITIPSIFIGQGSGTTISAELGNGLAGTLRADAVTTADTWRWLMAEDSTGFGGSIRDMWAPECLGDPSRVGDAERYVCNSSDNGGVHSNSGVPNHGYALLVDGGTFNSVSVPAIGVTKAINLYWRAMSLYHVPLSGFSDHADALEQSCTDLLGQPLPDPESGAVSGEVLDLDDCLAVAAAIEAVELRDDPPCSYEPLLDPDAPPLCEGSILETSAEWDFETDPGPTWTFEDDGVYAEYIPRSWLWTDDLPDDRPGSALFAADAAGFGNCQPGNNDQSGVVYATTPAIVLPEGSGPPKLVFDHYVASELLFDGGNVSISVNGGNFQLIDGDDFTFNGYNQILAPASSPNRNPLAGQMAFTGTNENSNEGSWGQSQIELSWYAVPGDTVRVRFAFGTDGCDGVDGWYIDDIRVVSCTQPEDGLDPFVCDRGRLSRGEAPFDPIADVELATQLDGSIITPFYDVEAPSGLCAPHALPGEDLNDSDTHLTSYPLDAGIALPPQALDVEVDTALGRIWVDTKGAETVLLPSAVSDSAPPSPPQDGLHVLDSYVCYKVRKARHAPKFPAGVVAELRDGEGSEVAYAVRKPSRLCVAADRDGAGIKNEGTWGHLLCYKAKRLPEQADYSGVTGLYDAGDFGSHRIDLVREQDVCVPATITDLASLGH